jgi:hypothetical protein
VTSSASPDGSNGDERVLVVGSLLNSREECGWSVPLNVVFGPTTITDITGGST